LSAPGRTTLPIAILQYLEWKIDPTIGRPCRVLQILFIGGAILVTDRSSSKSSVVLTIARLAMNRDTSAMATSGRR